MSKGSSRRPHKVTEEELNKAWDRIFKTTKKIRKKNGENESNTTDVAKTKERWVDNSSDC